MADINGMVMACDEILNKVIDLDDSTVWVKMVYLKNALIELEHEIDKERKN